MKNLLAVAAMALVVSLGAGCSQKAPAQKSIDTAEQALSEIDDQAQQYVPAKYAAVKAELDEARKAFRDGKYQQAIKVAAALPAKAKAVGEEASAARQEMEAQVKAQWEPLSAAMPGRIEALDARVAELDKARRLPKGVDREAVDAAKAQLGVVQKAWKSAQDAYAAGQLKDAMVRAKGSELLVLRLMQSIGAAPPDKPKADQPAG